MWPSRWLRAARRSYAMLDYARHMPKEYVEKAKGTVPRIVFGNRFGAPAITQWRLHPDDYEPSKERPWEREKAGRTARRIDLYHEKKLRQKFFALRYCAPEQIPANEWTILPGDEVQVMVGKDKGRQGVVTSVVKEINSVFVDGLHTILEEDKNRAKYLGAKRYFISVEQPLNVKKKQVMLVDPNTSQPCEAKWVLNDAKDDYIRISQDSGCEIPIPSRAAVTYEYVKPESYIEVEDKDTPPSLVLQRTYTPKLCTFEDEIMQEMRIEENRERKPTYWY